MKIFKNNDSLFDDCMKLLSDNVWNSPEYSCGSYNYYAQRPIDEGYKVRDCSFLIEEDEPLILFRGAKIELNNRINLIFGALPCVVFEFKKSLSKKTKKIFKNEFENIIEKINGTIWCRDFLIDAELDTLSCHLLSKGATATPVFSRVIDLTNDEAQLRSGIRNRYKTSINWGLREIKPQVLGMDELTWEQMLTFRNLHIRESKRETRSEMTWRKQFDMVKADEAFVVLGQLDNELVSAGLFSHNKINCYYQISASRRDLFKKPLFHAIMWTAILHAKKLGCRWFEVGEQLFQNQTADRSPTKKELEISGFKSGFGGETRIFLDLKLDC